MMQMTQQEAERNRFLASREGPGDRKSVRTPAENRPPDPATHTFSEETGDEETVNFLRNNRSHHLPDAVRLSEPDGISEFGPAAPWRFEPGPTRKCEVSAVSVGCLPVSAWIALARSNRASSVRTILGFRMQQSIGQIATHCSWLKKPMHSVQRSWSMM